MKSKNKKNQSYLYNEHDINQVQYMRKKIKEKKKRRRQRVVLVLVLIVLLICFFCSDLSKVQTVKVTGLQRLDDNTIIDNISVKAHETYFFNVDRKQLKKEVESMLFVKSAKISQSLFVNVTISIEEDEPVTYCYINNLLYIVDQKGNIKEDKEQKWLSYAQRTPQSMNFDLENFKKFIKEYVKIPSVVKNQISSIIFEPDEKDKTKCKFELDDGKIFYVRIENMAKQLTSSNYYLVVQKYPNYHYYDFLGKNVYVYN